MSQRHWYGVSALFAYAMNVLAGHDIAAGRARIEAVQEPVGLFTSDPKAETLRVEIATGGLVARDNELAPCFAADPIAFIEERKSGGTWAARFVVERAGTGPWQLEVVAPDTRTAWRTGLDVADGTIIESGILRSARVTVRLLGPATAAQRCPKVRLVAELQEQKASLPRGLVGSDDRWTTMNPSFHQQKNAKDLIEWAQAVVHLQVVSRTGRLLPCSGFFVSANVLMTAAHCIGSVDEAPRSIVHLPDRMVTGTALKLLMAQADLDFALVRVAEARNRVTLRLGSASTGDLVLWQFPSLAARLVSVVGCTRTPSTTATFLTHGCDSSGGSSGSPLQHAATGMVVGLHTLGCGQGNGTARCVNGGWVSEAIRQRILELSGALKQWDPEATAELLKALEAR